MLWYTWKIGQEIEDTSWVYVDKVTTLDKVSFANNFEGKILRTII